MTKTKKTILRIIYNIAEQIANYLIVLSRSDKYKTVLTDNSLLNKLKYAVSTRSKIIYLLSCIIGIKKHCRVN